MSHMPYGSGIAGPAALVNANANAVVFGQPVYPISAGNFDLAKADTQAHATVIGLVGVASVANGATTPMVDGGMLTGTTSQWDAIAGTTGGLTFGTVYYLSPTTAGAITATAPTTAGQFVVQIGIGLSTTQLAVNIQPPIGPLV